MNSIRIQYPVGAVVGIAIVLSGANLHSQPWVPAKKEGILRVATYNASLNRSAAGKLTEDLQSNNEQIQAIATVVRAVQPDILLVNEIDYSTTADNAALLEQNYFFKASPDWLGGCGLANEIPLFSG